MSKLTLSGVNGLLDSVRGHLSELSLYTNSILDLSPTSDSDIVQNMLEKLSGELSDIEGTIHDYQTSLPQIIIPYGSPSHVLDEQRDN